MNSKLINFDVFISKRPDMEIHTKESIISCINSAYVLLDGECASLISKVDKFNMVEDRDHLDKENPLYRNDFEIQQLQEALVFQVQYVLNMGNDFTIGGGSYSIGNVNSSYSRPEGRELIAPGVYKLLSNARVYQLNAFGSFDTNNLINQKNKNLITSKEIMERVKSEYVSKHQDQATPGTIAYVNQNKNIDFGNPQDLNITTYNTKKIEGPPGYDNSFYRINEVPNIAFFGPDLSGTYSAVQRQELKNIENNLENIENNLENVLFKNKRDQIVPNLIFNHRLEIWANEKTRTYYNPKSIVSQEYIRSDYPSKDPKKQWWLEEFSNVFGYCFFSFNFSKTLIDEDDAKPSKQTQYRETRLIISNDLDDPSNTKMSIYFLCDTFEVLGENYLINRKYVDDNVLNLDKPNQRILQPFYLGQTNEQNGYLQFSPQGIKTFYDNGNLAAELFFNKYQFSIKQYLENGRKDVIKEFFIKNTPDGMDIYTVGDLKIHRETSIVNKKYVDNELLPLKNKMPQIDNNTNNINEIIKQLRESNIINYEGEYQEGKTYKLGQVVSFNNKMYLVKVETTQQQPTNTNDYDLLSNPEIDLNNYYTKQQIDISLQNKQNQLLNSADISLVKSQNNLVINKELKTKWDNKQEQLSQEQLTNIGKVNTIEQTINNDVAKTNKANIFSQQNNFNGKIVFSNGLEGLNQNVKVQHLTLGFGGSAKILPDEGTNKVLTFTKDNVKFSGLDFENDVKLINLPEPTQPQEASTKNYVDNEIQKNKNELQTAINDIKDWKEITPTFETNEGGYVDVNFSLPIGAKEVSFVGRYYQNANGDGNNYIALNGVYQVINQNLFIPAFLNNTGLVVAQIQGDLINKRIRVFTQAGHPLTGGTRNNNFKVFYR